MQEAYENALAYVLKRDATLVYKAGKGMGTHDQLLIQVITQRTKSQIEKIDMNYRELSENTNKRSLNEFLKSECSGDYLKFLKYMCKTRPKFLADQLSKAMDGK
jgi:valyl-tRNA synthetase